MPGSGSDGAKVLVRRCLIDKPQQHADPHFGWVLKDANFDPEKTELCEAVGLVMSLSGREWITGRPGILAIAFVKDRGAQQTAVFARVEDVEFPVDLPYSWPNNAGLVIIGGRKYEV